jgi:hypothetical protein
MIAQFWLLFTEWSTRKRYNDPAYVYARLLDLCTPRRFHV